MDKYREEHLTSTTTQIGKCSESYSKPIVRPQIHESSLKSLLGLRRITVSLAYRPELDGIRFLAIGCVVLFHVTGDILRHSPADYASVSRSWLLPVMLQLKFGVELFFVLSGFVLGLPFARHFLTGAPPVNRTRYLRRWLTRLEPPYILALLLLTSLKVFGGHYSALALLPHLAASTAYLHNLIYGYPSTIDFVAWSLEVEVQFYLLAPFLAALAFGVPSNRPRRIGLVGAILASGMLASLAPKSLLLDLSVLGYLPYFLAGFILADLDVLEPAAKACHPFWDAVAITAGFLVGVWIYTGPRTVLLLGPLTICAGYYGAFHSIGIKRLLSLPVVSTIGGMCYSIYLLHDHVIAGLGRYTEQLAVSFDFPGRLLLQFLMMIGPVLALSGIFYFFIERPCMQPDWPARLRAWCAASWSSCRRAAESTAQEFGDAS